MTLVERLDSIVDGYYYDSEDYKIVKDALEKQDAFLSGLRQEITMDTLDLRDPEVQRQFLEALKKYGVPMSAA